MDASDGATTNGGQHVATDPVTHPSAEAAPSGAPVSSSPAEAPAGVPEPLVIVDADDARDPNTGRIRKGKTLNPKGRAPGSPNLNSELQQAVKKYKLGQKSYLELLLTKSLQDVKYAELVVPKILANVDLPAAAAGVTIHNTPHASARADANSETYVDVAKLLSDAAGREGVAQFAERLAACKALTGEPRHVRQ